MVHQGEKVLVMLANNKYLQQPAKKHNNNKLGALVRPIEQVKV